MKLAVYQGEGRSGSVEGSLAAMRDTAAAAAARVALLCGREGNLTCCGLSCIVGPNGEDLERAGKGDEILIADIDPVAVAAVGKSNPMLPNRRPNLYAAPVKINPLGKQDKP